MVAGAKPSPAFGILRINVNQETGRGDLVTLVTGEMAGEVQISCKCGMKRLGVKEHA
jgi:hypothetical protein